jgi:hypothetical protein
LFSDRFIPVKNPNPVVYGIHWSDFESVVPGRTRIRLTLHHGLFGLPWLAAKYQLP